jgi:nitrate/nitrite transporter NarK
MKKKVFWVNVLDIFIESFEPSVWFGFGMATGIEVGWGNSGVSIHNVGPYMAMGLIYSLLFLLFRLSVFSLGTLVDSILSSIKAKRIILQDEKEVSAIKRRVIYHNLPEEEQKKLQSYMENLYETFHDRPIELGGKNRDI